jgi:uncharacterized protein (DUF488 family)
LRLWSVGHSTLAFADFVAVLGAHGASQIADIRTVPKSRRHPHFHADSLAHALPEAGIAYAHLPRLGGFRRPVDGSANTAWRNASFRGYADYTRSEEFASGLAELRDLAERTPTAMMCSEAVWWRCHRRLVADQLVVAGDEVWHITSARKAAEHQLTSFAFVGDDGQITYPEASEPHS